MLVEKSLAKDLDPSGPKKLIHKYNFIELLKKLIPKNQSQYALNLLIPDTVIFEQSPNGAFPKVVFYNQWAKDQWGGSKMGKFLIPYKVIKQKDHLSLPFVRQFF